MRRYTTPTGSLVGMMSPNGQYLLVQTTPDRLFRVMDAATGADRHTFHSINNLSPVQFHAFSPDSQTFFTGGNVVSALWDLRSGEQLHEMIGPKDLILTSFFSHDGRSVITSSFDKTVRIWNVETGLEVRRLALPFTPQNANFSADDATILVLDDDGKYTFLTQRLTRLSATSARICCVISRRTSASSTKLWAIRRPVLIDLRSGN